MLIFRKKCQLSYEVICFCFTPVFRFHGINERISCKNYEELVLFYFRLIQNSDIKKLPPSHTSQHDLWSLLDIFCNLHDLRLHNQIIKIFWYTRKFTTLYWLIDQIIPVCLDFCMNYSTLIKAANLRDNFKCSACTMYTMGVNWPSFSVQSLGAICRKGNGILIKGLVLDALEIKTVLFNIAMMLTY